MRFFLSFILIFIVLSVSAQINIKVTSPENDEDDYHLVNNDDTAFILIEYKKNYNGFLQKVPWQLKSNNPDGEYKVYLDDNLWFTAYYKNYQKDSIWIQYDRKGEIIRKELYKKGKSLISYINDEIWFSDSNQRNSLFVINLFETDSIYFKRDEHGIFNAESFSSKDEKVAYLYFEDYSWNSFYYKKDRPNAIKQNVTDFLHNNNLRCDTVFIYINGWEQIELIGGGFSGKRVLVRTDKKSADRLNEMYLKKQVSGFYRLSKYHAP